MKKIVIILTVLLAFTPLFAQGKAEKNTGKTDGKLSVVATIYPQYDWVKNIIGEDAQNIEVKLLIDSGVDLHSFQPNADDIIDIANCDLFIYVGGESDEWVKDVLEASPNPNRKVLNLLEALGDNVKEEELAEGMEHEHDQEEETEYDEHVWLSLKNAEILCKSIENALSSLDPANAKRYSENATAYIEKLKALDALYAGTVESASKKTLLFCDRFPFRYLVDDYGLGYYAAFSGCSAESDASFETITFLAGKVDELKLNTVLTIEGNKNKIAKTVISASEAKDVKVLVMDSMQSVKASDIKNGISYLSVMESNLETLKAALN